LPKPSTASQQPLPKISINKKKLKEGKDANIVIFEENLKIFQTFITREENYRET